MASHKLTKQEMRDDQFRDILSELYFGALASITENWRAFATGFAVVLLLLAGAFYLWQTHLAKEAETSYLLGQVMEAYNAPVEASPAAKGKRNQETYSSDLQRSQAVQSRLAAYKRQGSGAAPFATYYQALEQLQSGNLSGAEVTVTPLTKDPKLAPVALALRARIYEAQGSWDKAEGDWKALTSISTPAWTKADGYLALGEYYERRSQKDKAAEAYSQVEKLAAADPFLDALGKRAQTKVEALKGKA